MIIGKNNQTAGATLVVRPPDGYDAQSTAIAVTQALAGQPEEMVRTLTWDQGTEMLRWADIENTLGIEVYFCDRHCPTPSKTSL